MRPRLLLGPGFFQWSSINFLGAMLFFCYPASLILPDISGPTKIHILRFPSFVCSLQGRAPTLLFFIDVKFTVGAVAPNGPATRSGGLLIYPFHPHFKYTAQPAKRLACQSLAFCWRSGFAISTYCFQPVYPHCV